MTSNNSSSQKRKLQLVGIAGTNKDFLLALPTLKSFAYQDPQVKLNNDISISQYPLDQDISSIVNDLIQTAPEVIGFSCYTWNMEHVKEISRQVKRNLKGLEIILGGPEIDRESILKGKFNNSDADYLIFGEGERPFLNLLKGRINGIKGLAYKTGKGFVSGPAPDFINDLTQVPSPYFDGTVDDELLSRHGIRVNVESQRGCNFRCSYCLYHKNFPKIRYKNPRLVALELELAHKKGVKTGRILDANFLSNKPHALQLMQDLIKKNVRMSLYLEAHPMFIDKEVAEVFEEYISLSPENRLMVGMGVQTLNREALKLIRRDIPLEHFERAFGLLQEAGAIVQSDIILGLPRETKTTYLQALEYLSEKMRFPKNYMNLSLLRLLPGTELETLAQDEGIQLDQRGGTHYTYSTPTLSRQDILECLRLNTASFRLLSTEDQTSRMELRDRYFQVKNKLGVSNIQLLQYFSQVFSSHLSATGSEFVQEDPADLESYYFKGVAHREIPDSLIFEHLNYLERNGLQK